jgi:peptide-methionine (S)-S-oxide reductase
LDGVIRTQVGYAGGTLKNPTYYGLGDHSETIEIEFDPTKVSYKKLLDIFWESHEPTARSFSRQYAPFIFFHTDEQKRLAQVTKEQLEMKRGRKIYTEVVPAGTFYPAEDYHQKYYLRRYEHVVREISALYPSTDDFTQTAVAAKVNGYLGGNGTLDELKHQLKDLGLSPEAMDRIVKALSGTNR